LHPCSKAITNLYNDDIEHILELTADDLNVYPLPGWDQYMGYGAVNAKSALDRLRPPYSLQQWTSSGGGTDMGAQPSTLMTFFGAQGLPDGTYSVRRHEVRKTITFSSTNAIAWGRGVDNTIGNLGWTDDGSYNYGMGWSEVVPGTLTASSAVLRTFVYEVYSGNPLETNPPFIGWFPAAPGTVNFAYSVLGASSPFTAGIEGPSSVIQGQSASWSAYASGAPQPYTYQWVKDYSTVIGTGPTLTYTVTGGFVITLNVTSGAQTASRTMNISLGGGGGCPFVFSGTGSGYVEDNNILHRSELSKNIGKDIVDLYKLRIKPDRIDGSYRLQVREMNSDHSYFDQFRLLAVDHPNDSELAVTEDNQIIVYRQNDIQLADQIVLNESVQLPGDAGHFDGQSGDQMKILFSSDKLDALKSTLSKESGRSQQIALVIDFSATNKYQMKGGGGGEIAVHDDNPTLGKSSDHSSVNHETSIQFARRERNSVVLVPLSDGAAMDEFKISWTRNYVFNSIGIVAISKAGFATNEILLQSVIHSKAGSILNKLTKSDKRYAELQSSEDITLSFVGNDSPGGVTRDFILETHGFYKAGMGATTTIPSEFMLQQNYPNPFNPTTTISYGLKENVRVTLTIYNTLGQAVKTLVDRNEEAGLKSVDWNGRDDLGNQVASGIYVYKIQAGNFVQAKKMLLLK